MKSPLGSYETGFATELDAVKSQIALENRWIYGTPRWTKEGVGSLDLDSNEPKYVGEPTDELDQAWDDFIGERYFLITEDEARAAWGPNYRIYQEKDKDGYVAGLGVMHLLHCLNFIRQGFHSERYIRHEDKDPQLHLERQAASASLLY